MQTAFIHSVRQSRLGAKLLEHSKLFGAVSLHLLSSTWIQHSIQMLTIIFVSFEIDVSLSNYQVDESSKHTEDDEQFTREDEIMCSTLEEIS